MPRGKANHRWKGGRANVHGYIKLLMPNYPKAGKDGYVLEHIYVWETSHKKTVPTGWIIHHLNGIRDDNRLANLVVLSKRKHSLVLQAKAKRIQELEAILKHQGQLL